MAFSLLYTINFNDFDDMYDMYENKEELYENIEHFRNNYYETATLQSHYQYILKIHEFRKLNQNQFPTKKQFYLLFKLYCFCRFFIEDDEIFVLAADFFLKKTGNILNLSCSKVYYFYEFYTIERRIPTPAMTIGNKIGAMPPKLSLEMVS